MKAYSKSNILDLRWASVDLVRRQLWVNPDDAKGGKAVGIPLNGLAMTVLNECRDRHPDAVFTVEGRTYRRIDHRNWRLVADLPGCEFSRVRFHDPRHTWASRHVQAGTNLQTLMELGDGRAMTWCCAMPT